MILSPLFIEKVSLLRGASEISFNDDYEILNFNMQKITENNKDFYIDTLNLNSGNILLSNTLNAGYGSPNNKKIGIEEEKGGFNEIDLNKDDKMSDYEYNQIRKRRIDWLDKNNDKIITKEDYELRNKKILLEIDEKNDKIWKKID